MKLIELIERTGLVWLALAAVTLALSCEHAPAKAGPKLAPLTDVQREWVRECAKHSHHGFRDALGAWTTVKLCTDRARLLW